MGRKDTKVVRSISRMYEQMNLDSSEILHKTKLLLSVYRDVVWATLHGADEVHEDIYYFGSELTDALVYLEEFAPDTEKAEFEAKVSSLFENKWMIDLIDKAMTRVYDYHNNGRLYPQNTKHSCRLWKIKFNGMTIRRSIIRIGMSLTSILMRA